MNAKGADVAGGAAAENNQANRQHETGATRTKPVLQNCKRKVLICRNKNGVQDLQMRKKQKNCSHRRKRARREPCSSNIKMLILQG